uniref:Transmembrane protein n=1 Tax=Salix viminalis TaxID=40686 RepID=A0A6N2MYS6_SALVM
MENKREIITSPSPSPIRYLSHSSFSNPSFPFLFKHIITFTDDHQIFLPLLFPSSFSLFILVFSSHLFAFYLSAPPFFSGLTKPSLE